MKVLESCRLCPRSCGVDRVSGKKGFCGESLDIRIARAALHFWEEPCISGTNGSGTVFFSGCTMKCVFCQNYEVSTRNLGYEINEYELVKIFLDLAEQGAHNINLVTPTHFVPQIVSALDIAKREGLNIPIVYNTGGYECKSTLKMLDGYVDIYMPDFKYFSNELAQKYSSVQSYREIASAAVCEMYRQVGKPAFNSDGIMQRGMIIRHLMLPGSLSDTVKIINYVNKTFKNNVYFSLMSQYTPIRHIDEYPKLNNKIDSRCYSAAVDLCARLGMKNVFIQEGTAASESFIPEFSGNIS